MWIIINLILSIIATAGLSIYWFDVAKLGFKVKIKPFNCEPCFNFWIGLILFLLVPMVILMAIASATISFFVYKYLKQLYAN